MSLKLCLFITIICSSILLSACSYDEAKRQIIESHTDYALSAEKKVVNHGACTANNNQSTLSASSIKLISWNILAGCRQTTKNLAAFTLCTPEQADKSFIEFTKNKDLILIQEAYMDAGSLKIFNHNSPDYSWVMATSFIADDEKNIATGVLTIAKARSLSSCSEKSYDIILPTPKAVLFTYYNLQQNNKILAEKLLVVNIHGVLFSSTNLYQQLESIVKKISQHKGAVILAGDFNTMTAGSYEKLKEIIHPIALIEARSAAHEDHRVISILGQVYDFVFYKGLELVHTYSIDLEKTTTGKTSDHNPLFAEFKLDSD